MAATDNNKATGQVVTDPVAHDQVTPDAESNLVDGHTHGVDETGAAAPDQIDQVAINQEKMADPNQRDPRWPAASSMRVIGPDENDERAQELNRQYQEHKDKVAADTADRVPTMGSATTGERQAAEAASGENAGPAEKGTA